MLLFWAFHYHYALVELFPQVYHYKNGASKGASVSFLISTPQTGVDSILVTYSMLGSPFAIIRVIVALITGVIGGLLTNLLPSKDQIKEAPLDSCKTEIKEVNRLLTIVRYGFYEFHGYC